MGSMVYSLLWVMQGFYHQPYVRCLGFRTPASTQIIQSNVSSYRGPADSYMNPSRIPLMTFCLAQTSKSNLQSAKSARKLHSLTKPFLVGNWCCSTASYTSKTSPKCDGRGRRKSSTASGQGIGMLHVSGLCLGL